LAGRTIIAAEPKGYDGLGGYGTVLWVIGILLNVETKAVKKLRILIQQKIIVLTGAVKLAVFLLIVYS
jgi:hypothetical protein